MNGLKHQEHSEEETPGVKDHYCNSGDALIGLGLVTLLLGIIFSQWHTIKPGPLDTSSMMAVSFVVIFVGLMMRSLGELQEDEGEEG